MTAPSLAPSAGNPHLYDYDGLTPPPTPLSPTLVEGPRSDERPSIELKISRHGANILDAVVVDPAGRPLYSISSNGSPKTLLLQRNGTEVATIDWGRSSPRMIFRGKKFKCKEWLPRTGPNTEYELMLMTPASPLTWEWDTTRTRMFTHGNSQLTWMQQSDSGFLIPANQPGLAVATWHTDLQADGLYLQIFQEVLHERGLLEAILLSLILLQSGNRFGDTLPSLNEMGPKYFGLTMGNGPLPHSG